MVEPESRVDGQVQDGDTAAGDGLRPYGIMALGVFGNGQKEQPYAYAQDNAPSLSYPVVFEGQPQEEPNAQRQGNGAYDGKPVQVKLRKQCR